MNIIVPIKVLADDQDIVVAADRSLDDSKAHRIVSTYDLNAIEAAVQLASAHEDSKVVCVSVADAKADDSKLKKGILARGVDELVMIADDACADLDAHATAAMLARLVDGLDAADLIVCGDGSADNYAQQVDVQLAAKLGLDTVAEGIEDERQLAFLQSVGCGLVQDYVFAEPLPFDEFERWADTRARAVASGAGSASRSVPGMPAASRNVRTAASMSR